MLDQYARQAIEVSRSCYRRYRIAALDTWNAASRAGCKSARSDKAVAYTRLLHALLASKASHACGRDCEGYAQDDSANSTTRKIEILLKPGA